MKKARNKVVNVLFEIAKKANGSASLWLSYQPREPQSLRKTNAAKKH